MPNHDAYAPIRAIIFDLDGVITDTAEYHYLSWKRLADEEGLPFSRAINEQLRGVSRAESLNIILAQAPRQLHEAARQELMARKNAYYNEMIAAVSAADLLPGVQALLEEIQAAGLKIAIASASRNAPAVVERLGIGRLLSALAHGGTVQRQKPAPDLFLATAQQLGLPPTACLVVEDAAAGIAAAHAAGMVAVGLGPAARVGAADLVLPSLEGVSLAQLSHAATWRVAEPLFDETRQHHRETIFTTGNGYLATRGALEEGYPGDRPATLVHGLWDDVPLALTELANAPRWTDLQIWVNGQRFDMAQSGVAHYARYLDMRDSCLRRRLRWTAPDGAEVELAFQRFASLADQHALVLQAEITPLNRDATIRVRAMLDGHVENESYLHWRVLQQESAPHEAGLLLQTRSSGKRLAMSATLESSGDLSAAQAVDCPGSPGLAIEARRAAGQPLSVAKLVAVYTSRDVEDPLAAARHKLQAMRRAGASELLAANVAAWRRFWQAGDVLVEGDDEAQTALRHALFQLRIAAPTHDERVSIGAKTLSGFGYRGHVFWDTEIFVLPYFSYTQPQLARNMLMYRYHTLPGARRKAAANGFRGAQFAWESAETGDEVTPTWLPHFEDPTRLVRIWTGDIELHISADIAYAARQYWRISGDDDFWRDFGAQMVLETALFWGDCVQREGQRFVLRDVIGPDEYHDHVDNNIFTNTIARWHLQTALQTLAWLQERAPKKAAELAHNLALGDEVLAHWRDVIDNIVILQDPHSGLMEQFEGFFDLEDVDWAAYAGRTRSMQAILGIEGANRAKVLKQPDAIALLALFGEQFDEAVWHTNWDYYAPITDHSYGSSLGPAMHAWVAARLGKIDEAYDHFMRAARADLLDVRGNAGDGIHAASAGGLWQAAVFGFAGLHFGDGRPGLRPNLPRHWRRLAFRCHHHGRALTAEITQEGGEIKADNDGSAPLAAQHTAPRGGRHQRHTN